MVGDGELAVEYTQDTFIRTFERLATFRGEAALSTWIGSIAISVVYNGQRKAGRRRSREVDLEHAEPVATPSREAEPDLKIRLARAIDGQIGRASCRERGEVEEGGVETRERTERRG